MHFQQFAAIISPSPFDTRALGASICGFNLSSIVRYSLLTHHPLPTRPHPFSASPPNIPSKQRYYCRGTMSPEIRDCLSCIPPKFMEPNTQCSSCCGNATECELEWSWGAVLATLSVSAVFATCSGVLALTENRRKRKGMSLARAWSIPQGMPMVKNFIGCLPVGLDTIPPQ